MWLAGSFDFDLLWLAVLYENILLDQCGKGWPVAGESTSSSLENVMFNGFSKALVQYIPAVRKSDHKKSSQLV